MAELKDLLGKTLSNVEVKNNDGDEIIFTTMEGKKYKMCHMQQCCEGVWIESIVGDLSDLIGEPLLRAQESQSFGNSDYGSFTWTFYKLATCKGYVDIRWNGESNGSYSEDVDFEEID